MNLVPVEFLNFFWIGFAAVCMVVAGISLLRVEKIRAHAGHLSLALVVVGAILFVAFLLSPWSSPERTVLDWVYASSGTTSLRFAFRIDPLSGWSLGFLVLLLSARAAGKASHAYLPAGMAFAIAGALIAWTSESIWAAIFGWTLLASSGHLVRLGLIASDTDASAHLSRDVLRSSVFVLLIWVSALALETLGFQWDFNLLPNAFETEGLLGVFLFSVIGLCIPWATLSNLYRPEETGETENVLFSGVLLPASVAGSIYRFGSNLEGSIWLSGAGYWSAALGVLFFLVYIASKSRSERLRALGAIHGSLVLSAMFLFPSWCAVLFILGMGAVVGVLVVGSSGNGTAVKRTLLFLTLMAAAGMPGFLPGLFLHRLWLDIGTLPVESGCLLFVHLLFLIAALREAGVAFFEKPASPADLVQAVPITLLVIFILAPWTSGTWTGGFLDRELDAIVAFQDLPWVTEFNQWMSAMSSDEIFAEGRWIQLAIAFTTLLLLLAFQKGDPFATREDSWKGFRRVASKDLGVNWLGEKIMIGPAFIGSTIENRVLAPVWERVLPSVGRFLLKYRLIASAKIEAITESFTGARWNALVAAPSYLIQAMTNGRSNWYLFFTILGTFILVLHSVLKLS